MSSVVQTFEALKPELGPSAGGKGSVLARLYQAGYPVPEGFVILPEAFQEDNLSAEAWSQIEECLQQMRSGSGVNMVSWNPLCWLQGGAIRGRIPRCCSHIGGDILPKETPMPSWY